MTDPAAALDDPGTDRHWSAYAPSFFPELDCSGLHALSDVERVIERDFSAKAPRALDIAGHLERDEYQTRFELLRDVTRYLYWTHRYFLTLYELRPCRYEDLPRDDPSARLPVISPAIAETGLPYAVRESAHRLSPRWEGGDELRALKLLEPALAAITFDPEPLRADLPTIGLAEADPTNMLIRVSGVRLAGPPLSRREALQMTGTVPELTALLRQSAALASEHAGRWGPPEPTRVCNLQPADFVLVATARSAEVASILRDEPLDPAVTPQPLPPDGPQRSTPPERRVRRSPTRGRVDIAGLAAVKGEILVTNDDIVGNAAWHWSPMTSADIATRTGILERRYTERSLDDIASEAAARVLTHGIPTQPVGAVIACSCTNVQPVPSLATRVANRLGLTQLVAAFDVVAACAGLPYGLAQAAHIVEAAGCAVLLVLAEKFSDKLGTVRSSRMLFGDGAAAMLLIPARRGLGDVELVQTYAGGSRDELAAIAWPDPDFNNHLTVQGPGARSIVERYLAEILRELPGSTAGAPLPAGADVIVPHQANERMVRELSEAAGIPGSALYFNVASVGNLSAASIPVAIYDGVQGGAISNDTRVLTPAFGAGAVAGVALIKLREPVVDAIKHAQNSGVGIAGPAAPRDPEPGGRMPAHNQAAAEV